MKFIPLDLEDEDFRFRCVGRNAAHDRRDAIRIWSCPFN